MSSHFERAKMAIKSWAKWKRDLANIKSDNSTKKEGKSIRVIETKRVMHPAYICLSSQLSKELHDLKISVDNCLFGWRQCPNTNQLILVDLRCKSANYTAPTLGELLNDMPLRVAGHNLTMIRGRKYYYRYGDEIFAEDKCPVEALAKLRILIFEGRLWEKD